jgi:hypothetical protein
MTMLLIGCPKSAPGPIYKECDCVTGKTCRNGQCVPATGEGTGNRILDVGPVQFIDSTRFLADSSLADPGNSQTTPDESSDMESANSDVSPTMDGTTPGEGTITVHFQYEGPVPLQNIEIALATATADCLDFGATDDWSAAGTQKMVSGVDSTPQFSSLTEEEHYLVAARAHHDGQLAAAGCVDKIFVPAQGGEIHVDMPLFLLLLNPAGTYDATMTLDLGPLFPASFPALPLQIQEIETMLFPEIAAHLAEVVEDNCLLGGPDACPLMQDSLTALMPGCWANHYQPLPVEFMQASSAIMTMLAPTTLASTLKLQPPQGAFMIAGTYEWQELSVLWDWGCPTEDPDYEQCSTRSFTMAELESAPYPVKLAAADFTSLLANFDQLVIDTHTLSLSAAELALFLLDSLVFPSSTAHAGFHEWLQTLGVDCAKLGDCIGAELFAPFPDKIADLVQACELAVQNTSGSVQTTAAEFVKTNAALSIHGKCLLQDDDGDLKAEALVDGWIWGHQVLERTAGNDFSGTFEAHRK